jgi:hypothetical protein
VPNINSIYKEVTADWTSSSYGVYEDVAETSALSSGGKYLVIVNVQFVTDINEEAKIRTLFDGVELGGSLSSESSRSSSHETRYSYFTMVEPSSSGKTIKIQAQASSGHPVSIKTATISCLDLQNLVAGSDYIFTENSLDSTNTNSYQEMAYINIPATKNTAGDWLVLSAAQFNINSTSVSLYQKIEYKGLESFPEIIQTSNGAGSYRTNYMQRIVSVPFLGYPEHLGGTTADGGYKRLSLKTKDSSTRETNNTCKQAKVFALRLAAAQHTAYYQSSSSSELLSSGDFDTVASLSNYNPPQDDASTSAASQFTTGKTLILTYGGFNPNGTTGSDERCWMNITWSDPSLETDFIAGFSDESIFVSGSSYEKNPIGFAGIQAHSAVSGPKKITMKVKTYSDIGLVYDASICVIGLGAPVPTTAGGPRAKLEMNPVIRLS